MKRLIFTAIALLTLTLGLSSCGSTTVAVGSRPSYRHYYYDPYYYGPGYGYAPAYYPPPAVVVRPPRRTVIVERPGRTVVRGPVARPGTSQPMGGRGGNGHGAVRGR